MVVPVSAPNAYGTIRSLAARGVRVLALDHESVPLRRSRLCRFLSAPDPDRDPRRFVAFLRDLATSLPAPPVVFATQDIHATVIQRHAGALRDFIRYPFLPFERFRACVDKRLMLRRAEELGLPVPETHAPGDPDALERLLPRLARYPYILKPAAKFEWNGDDPRDNFRFHRAYRTKALRARTPDELRRRFTALAREGYTMLVQEEIEGPTDRLCAVDFYADASGRILAHHTGRKLRQLPADFGTCTLGCSCRVERVLEWTRLLVAGLGFRGLGNVEFKEREGRHYLMELNPRPWMWIQLATVSGVNLPVLAYRDLAGLPVGETALQTVGSRWMDIRLDCRHLRGEAPVPLAKWLRSLRAVRVDGRGSPGDPLPVLDAVGTAAGRRFRRGLDRLGRGGVPLSEPPPMPRVTDRVGLEGPSWPSE